MARDVTHGLVLATGTPQMSTLSDVAKAPSCAEEVLAWLREQHIGGHGAPLLAPLLPPTRLN